MPWISPDSTHMLHFLAGPSKSLDIPFFDLLGLVFFFFWMLKKVNFG